MTSCSAVMRVTPIHAGDGNNVVLGDNGAVSFFGGKLDLIQSTETGDDAPAQGGSDSIFTGAGNDVIVGGFAGDTINAGDGNNVVFGDSAVLDFAQGTGVLLTAISTGNAYGGDDGITTGSGNDLVVGGVGTDTINAGDGNNIVVGDNGSSSYDPVGGHWTVTTTTPAIGGMDSITTGVGNDLVIGGAGGDTITDLGGTNIVLGDQGNVDWVLVGGTQAYLDRIAPTDPTIGGNDTITISGSGDNYVIGGTGNDIISTGSGDDLIFGDFGQITGTIPLTLAVPTGPTTFTYTSVFTQNSDGGGNDTINAGNGRNVVIGGQGGDTITTGSGDDDIVGGSNVAGGQDGSDIIDGGAGNDVIAGDNALILPRGDTVSLRVRALTAATIYTIDAAGNIIANIGGPQADPTGVAERTIVLFDSGTTDPTLYGNDVPRRRRGQRRALRRDGQRRDPG